MVGVISFAACLGTLAVYSGSATPPEAAAVASSSVPGPSPMSAVPDAAASSTTASLQVEASSSVTAAALDLEKLKEEIRQRELQEAAEVAARQALEKEAAARALEQQKKLERQKALDAAQVAARAEREARERADKELHRLQAPSETAEPALPPPTPTKKSVPVPPPVKAKTATPKASAPADPPASAATDPNEARSLWEYIPPAESVADHEASESWREPASVTPLHIQSSSVPSAQQPWSPNQPKPSEARIQLIQGNTVWVSIDRKKTEPVTLGQAHSTLGVLKSINGNTVTFDKAQVHYAP